MKFTSDVDIDMADRNQLLEIIDHTCASIRTDNLIKRHNSGIYPTNIPYDPQYDIAAISYEQAEQRGYIKIDLLNVWLYKLIKDENHLLHLMREPDWGMLAHRETVEKVIHLYNHWDAIASMPEPINSIPRVAMMLALIRPSKRWLIGKKWNEVAKFVWNNDGDGYIFKRSHAISYAHLVVVHLNLLLENPKAYVLQA
jgi:hypothetical protein